MYYLEVSRKITTYNCIRTANNLAKIQTRYLSVTMTPTHLIWYSEILLKFDSQLEFGPSLNHRVCFHSKKKNQFFLNISDKIADIKSHNYYFIPPSFLSYNILYLKQ